MGVCDGDGDGGWIAEEEEAQQAVRDVPPAKFLGVECP